jgi:hypothetical protein
VRTKVRQVRWSAVALLAVAAVTLAGCSAFTHRKVGAAEQASVAVSGGSAATLRLPGGATVTVAAGAVTGTGRLVGSVLASPPAPRAGLPAGHAYDFHLTGAKLTGQVTLTLPAPPAAAAAGGSGPNTAMLAYFDQSTRDWTPVPSTYDPVHHTVTAQSSHLSWWWPFHLDYGPIKTGFSNALKTVFGVNDTAQQPTCPGGDQLKAAGFVVGTDHPRVPILKSCAGVSGGRAQLRIANNRGYAMSVEYPNQWTASTSSASEVDQAIAAWVSSKIAVPPRGRKIAIVPSGQTVTLTAIGDQNPIVTVTADSQAYLASAFLYGVDTLGMVLGKIPGTKMPAPSALARAVKTLDTSTQCIRQGIDLTRTDPSTAAGVADVFSKTFKLAIGCLQDLWEVAYAVAGGIAAFVVGAIDWLITGVGQVIQGIVATVDSIHYFNGINFSVQGPASAVGALTFGSWHGAKVGMTEAEVQAAVGTLPVRPENTCDALGTSRDLDAGRGPNYTIYRGFDRSTDKLVGIQPPASAKTDRGIGVGATAAEVRRAYPQLSWVFGNEGTNWIAVATDPAHTDRALGFDFGNATDQNTTPGDGQTVTGIDAGTSDYVSGFEVCSG